MILNWLDWTAIGLFLLMTLLIVMKFAGRAGKNIGEFLLAGRRLPWYIAGISMVATTFAADTPLAVTEIVNKNGIAGNWLWWNFLIGGMLTTFFFARLWRKAEIFTDNELIELRYRGKAAAFLRGFKSIYLGLFINAVVIGWVNKALITILVVFFNIPEAQALWYVAGAMVFTAAYASLSGMWGVAITDFVQFSIAMTGCIILAVKMMSLPQVGGIEGLKAKLPEATLQFLPNISFGGSSASTIAGGLTISLATFLAFIGVQWWASWYPGAEPGGGGYVAQRMMSAKDEKNSLWATLFFQIAHYCIRPWPWILVALAVIIVYPDPHNFTADQLVDFHRHKYVMAMRDYLPAGLRGLLLVTFLAAYMSSVSSQLNWGASYLVNDFYKRFLRPEKSFATVQKAQTNYVLVSRLSTLFIMGFCLFATMQMTSISGAWSFVIECGAGLGLVLILRWYWWRINAWSEITATIVPFIVYGTLKTTGWLVYPDSFFATVGITTVAWLTVTFLTKPEKMEVLQAFYTRVTPEGGWGPVRSSLGLQAGKNRIPYLLLAWFSAILMTYSILFLIGNIIFQNWEWAGILFVTALAGFLILRYSFKPAGISGD